ncbi:metallophosphoesterase [Streptomyces sp. NPDC015414]|uniref:metallophosphoesterase n=1 Tax=Streptomyces sp. NPDC015414 TaxID=3364957 RepID=UPI0036F8B332
MVVLAQISDLHLDGTDQAAERAARVMRYLASREHPVDAVLVTGDIADHGTESEYEQAAAVLTGPFPVLTCPGNHDVRGPYRKVLLGEPASDGPVNRLHHVAGTAILMCDATIPGRDEGLLAPETLRWLASALAGLDDGTPALVAFHQPPVRLHHPLPDGSRLERPEDLAGLLAAHPQVVAVLTGHAHTAAASVFAGRPLLVSPAVTWNLRLPWETGTPVADQPPGVAFHVLDEERRLTTHFRVVP